VETLEGGKIGHYTYEVKSTYEEASEEYNYQPASGTMVRIEDVSALPTNVKPGDHVELAATYALLDASLDADIKVTEIREIRYEGELVGRPEVTLTHKGGTYSSTVPLFLPKHAKTGTYKVIITIQTHNASDSSETHFTVT
jgi:hypothetical protein